MGRVFFVFFALLISFGPLAGAVAGEEFPGISQVPALAADISAQAVQAERQMEGLLDTAAFETQLDLSEGRIRQVLLRMEQYGDPATWSIDRLLEVRAVLQDERSRLERVLQTLAGRQAEGERLQRAWDGQRRFWREWEEQLVAGGITFPRETFAQVQETIGRVRQGIEESAAPLVVLQEELTRLLNQNLAQLTLVDSALRQLRGQLFERTGHPLISGEFFRQFTEGFLDETRRGVRDAVRIDTRNFYAQSWVILSQALVIFVTAGFILRYRRRVEGTEEWRFILSHPWATGIFVSMAALSPLYSIPPALWRLVLWILFAYSAAVLISGLVRNPLKRFTVFLLATILVVSLGLQLINLPTPLLRLFMASLALVGIPLSLALARINIARHEGRVGLFSLGLRAGALICLVSFLAQLAGYSTLAAHLIDASIKSVFVGIFAVMTVRLGQGGIDFFLEHPLALRRTFVTRFGAEVGQRLKTLLAVLVGAGAFYHFLAVWGIYDSFGQAWDHLTGVGLTLGQVHLTLAMVLLSLLVIYLAIQISWILRAILDTQVFPYSSMDRGISDAIKKLLHYFLVFLGFLFAMSLAGIEMRNFAVLAGAFGIGIGFGLQNIVNNFVSGLILLFERPVKVGDMIVVDEDWGTVRKIGLRSTIIETFDNSELIVPNSQLIAEKVTNWTLSTTRARVVLSVGVAYGSDVELVLDILKEVGDRHPQVLADPGPSAIFVGFGDSSLDFELRGYIADVTKRLSVRSDLGREVDRRFREAGVEIPFPQRDLHLRSVDGEILRRARPQEVEEPQSQASRPPN
ncbi:mechanosensitive ion channel domain-containing protein [Geoalkalibacter halelectricus]|uniref:Mechanosensitive ion channel n=1 Tax=Geoalkalibacter halelectricus TaxID=2847045 RepID=A0ABY5ZFY3_9BACT|nr:mechanosensitive ion channel domain-containing protein [Geoalkalibacter halelectricus]MDO3378170.1 mechanosensitive ion channel [Geoalkalibacter halelectricus]UWZ78016.1 mechanosensitive ion channel [Geoalkalibacter halelectricus]